MREVFDFLKKAGVFFIATEEGDQPRVRPFGAVDVFEDRIYLQTGRDKAFSRQIAVNPKVELCAFVIELFDLHGREALKGYRVESLTRFPGH